MQIRCWHYTQPSMSEGDATAVAEACAGPILTQGPCVAAFEQAVVQALGHSEQVFAVAVANGSAGLYLAARALGLRAGLRAWTTPLTFVATVNALKMCQARVELIDIDPHTWLIEPAGLAACLEQAAARDRLPHLVALVDFAGLPCDWAALRELADHYGIRLLADSCQALGARYADLPLGGKWADITVFSLHPAKTITTGEGGLVLTRDAAAAERLRADRAHGMVRGSASEPWRAEQVNDGFNFRLTEMQAALGLSQLERLTDFLTRRRHLAALYRTFLADFPVAFQAQPERRESAHHLCVARFDFAALGMDKHCFFERLRARGVHLYVHYLPIHQHRAHANLGYERGDFPVSEAYYQEAFSLPLYPDLKDEEVEEICDIIRTEAGQ